MIVRRVGALLALGLGLGVVGGLWLSRWIQALLFDQRPHDPWTFVTGAAVFVVAGGIAAWLPACSVTRLDPSSALREG